MADWFQDNAPSPTPTPQDDWFAQNAPKSTAVAQPSSTPQSGEVTPPDISGIQAATDYGQQQGAPTIPEQRKAIEDLPPAVRNPLEAASETASGLVPKSLSEVGGLAASFVPPVQGVQDIGRGATMLKDVLFGKPIDEATAQAFPETQVLPQAEQTAPFSKERYKAGFDTLAQLGMAAAVGRGIPTKPPTLTETLGFSEKQPEVVQAANDALTELESKYAPPEAVPAAAEATTNVLGKQEPVAEPTAAGTGGVEPPISATVYHGSKTESPTFEIRPRGNEIGVHFGTAEQADWRVGDEGFVKPYNIEIQKPLRLEDQGGWYGESAVKEINSKIGSNLSPSASVKTIRETIQKAGYDGIVYKNTFENPDFPADSYIVFDKNQIKPSPVPEAPVSTTGSGIQETGGVIKPGMYHGTREQIEGGLKPGLGKNQKRFLHEEGIWFAPHEGVDFETSTISEARRYSGDSGTIVKADLKLKNPYYGDVDDLASGKINTKWLKENGYDGFVDDKSGSGFVVVLDKSQIKEISRKQLAPSIPETPESPTTAPLSTETPANQIRKAVDSYDFDEQHAGHGQLAQDLEQIDNLPKPLSKALEDYQNAVEEDRTLYGERSGEPSVYGDRLYKAATEHAAPETTGEPNAVAPEIPEDAKATVKVKDTSGNTVDVPNVDAKEWADKFTKERDSYKALIDCLGR